MAISKYSTPFQVSTPVDSVDTNMLATTVGGLQGKYDQGYLAISSTLDAYKKPGLVAEKDQAYLNQKVQALTEQIDGFGNENLADIKVVNSLNKHAQSLANDSEVVDMVSSQSSARSLIEKYDKLKTNPKLMSLYSSDNEKLQMKALEDWRTGKTKSFRDASPILKYDVDKFAQEIASQLKPMLYTAEDGSYLLNGKKKTADDITTVVDSRLSTNPEAQAQMMRHAQAMFMNNKPEEIFEIAVKSNDNDVKRIEADLKYKREALLRADLTVDQKADLEAGVDVINQQLGQVKKRGQELMSTGGVLTTQMTEELKYKLYKDNYVRGVAQTYVMDDKVRTANPVTMQRDKFVNETMQNQLQYKQTQERDAIKMSFEAQQKNLDRGIEMSKLVGGNQAAVKLMMEGKTQEALALINGGANDASYTSLPTLQEASDPYAEVQTTLGDLKKQNIAAARKMVQTIVQNEAPDMYHSIKGVFEGGQKVDAKALGKKYHLSPAMLNVMANYQKLQDDLIHPEKLTDQIINNPLMATVGDAQNKIIENTIRADALRQVITPDLDDVYNKMLAEGKVKNRPEFDAAVDAPEIKTDKSSYFGTRTPSWENYATAEKVKSNLGREIRSIVSGKVKVNPRYKQYNEFNTIQSVGTDDKRWNTGTGDAAAIRRYLKNGVVVDNKVMGIDGQSDQGTIERSAGKLENIDINKSLVKGFVDSKNRVYFDIASTDKDEPMKEGYVDLNDDDYRKLRNTSANQIATNNFTRNLYASGGKMVDGAGKQTYLNLNGKLKMGGNVKYSFDAFDDDELTLSVLIPTDTKPQRKVLGRFNGEAAKMKAEQTLIDVYNDLRNKTAGKLRTADPKITNDAIERQTLTEYYKAIKAWKIQP